MKGKPRTVIILFLMGSVAILFSPGLFTSVPVNREEFLSIENRTANSGNHYTIFQRNKCTILFVTSRPKKDDRKIMLCIPAAFTDVDKGAIDGACVCEGEPCSCKRNSSLDGAFVLANNEPRILKTENGKLLTDSLLGEIRSLKGSVFQQVLLVWEGKASTFADKKNYQRRAIAQFRDNKWAIVESLEAITQNTFTLDLQELGVYNALYTDMGSFDEGWYRWPGTGKRKKLGQLMNQTSQQSNWLIFKAE